MSIILRGKAKNTKEMMKKQINKKIITIIFFSEWLKS